MIHNLHNSAVCSTMDLFNEIDGVSEFFMLDRNTKLDAAVGEFQDLQTKYSSLHENYTKEIENSKKVEKCLLKCLKFYSKLCKKYEAQQKIIASLEEDIKVKVASLEESLRNEEKLKGLIEVYKCERSVYAGATNKSLKKDKELLLDVCCRLISQSVNTNSTANLTNLILRKFRKDLDIEKLNLLRFKNVATKKESELGFSEDKKPDLLIFKSEKLTQSDENFWEPNTKEEKCCDAVAEEEVKNCDEAVDLSENALGEFGEHLGLDSSHDCAMEKDGAPSLDIPGSRECLESSGGDYVACDLPMLEDEANLMECDNFDIVDGRNESVNDTAKNTAGEDSAVENRTNGSLVPQDVGNPEFGLPPEIEDSSSAEDEMSQVQQPSGYRSIFDIPDIVRADDFLLSQNTCNVNTKEKFVSSDSEMFLFFNTPVETEEGLTGASEDSVDNKTVDDSGELLTEEDLYRIFNEITHIRMLSPIKEVESSMRLGMCKRTYGTRSEDLRGESRHSWDTPGDSAQKRSSEGDGVCGRGKKMRTEGAEEARKKCSLLDSILSAMSVQNEEFKQNVISSVPLEASVPKTEPGGSREVDQGRLWGTTTRTYSRKGASSGRSECPSKENPPSRGGRSPKDKVAEKLVMDEIKSFVSSPILSTEDANKNVKQCIQVMANKSEDIIARAIVTMVLENVDEDVEVFERPAPPLTKTQHRLMVLLSVFRTLDPNSEKLVTRIMSLLTEKLFPENFFWPDDCVEAASRFYTALCKGRNDAKTLWKFCLQAMTEMRQRCCLVVFTALKTWPDALHDASTLKNNILAVTIANIFLHMPKAEGLRNSNQKKKLTALKHLLINFYQFRVDDTMETYVKKVVDSVLKGEVGSEKSLVLLSTCRERSWTCKNILCKLKATLDEWAEGRVEESAATRVLAVMKQIAPLRKGGKDEGASQVKEAISCLGGLLASRKMSHAAELNIVDVLLELKQHPDARRAIREWMPKCAISESLRDEIVNVSAENILRELKMNRRKDSPWKGRNARKSPKTKSKGNKKGKKKGKKRKSGETKPRMPPTPGVA